MSLSAANPELLEQTLSNNNFLIGAYPTQLDFSVFREFEDNPPTAQFPNLLTWYNIISQLPAQTQQDNTQHQRLVINNNTQNQFMSTQQSELAESRNEEQKVYEGGLQDSSIKTFQVKPISSSVDLDQLAIRIMSEISFGEDLKWLTAYKKEHIAFGIQRLLISCRVKKSISIDEIIEQITAITGLIEDSDEEDENNNDKNMVEGPLVQSVDLLDLIKI